MPTAWFLIAGSLLIAMALGGSLLKRLPLTAAMAYLAVGALLGPSAAGILRVDPIADAEALEWLTELAVIVSLFTAGLKLRLPRRDVRWRPALILASATMIVTIAGIAAVAFFGLGLPAGASLLLGAVLAPTDPVLASDVQVEHEQDAEPLRFALTGEVASTTAPPSPSSCSGLA